MVRPEPNAVERAACLNAPKVLREPAPVQIDPLSRMRRRLSATTGAATPGSLFKSGSCGSESRFLAPPWPPGDPLPSCGLRHRGARPSIIIPAIPAMSGRNRATAGAMAAWRLIRQIVHGATRCSALSAYLLEFKAFRRTVTIGNGQRHRPAKTACYLCQACDVRGGIRARKAAWWPRARDPAAKALTPRWFRRPAASRVLDRDNRRGPNEG